MDGLVGADFTSLLIKILWILSVAGALLFGAGAIAARGRLAETLRALRRVSDQRDEALAALEHSRLTIADLEQQLATQSDSIRLSMAVIDERLAEARRSKLREAQIKRLLAADPHAGESRVETANRLIGEALKEPRTWSDPS